MAEQRVYYKPDNHQINEARRIISNRRTNPYREQLNVLSQLSRLEKVAGLVEILGNHHPNTLVHSFEDTLLAVNLATGILGKPNKNNLGGFVEIFEDGLLHDIGKIGVASRLLNSKDRSNMTVEDRQTIRMHGAYGGAILNLVGLKSRAYISYEHDLASGTENTWRGIVNLETRHELTEIVSMADLIGGLMDTRRPYHPPITREYMSWIVDIKGRQGVFSERLVKSFKENVAGLNLYPPFELADYEKNELFMALIHKYGLSRIFDSTVKQDQLTRQAASTRIDAS